MKQEEPTSLPRGWTEARIGEICVEKVEQREPGAEPVPYIDIGSINRDTKTIGEFAEVTAATAPTRARQWLRAGDVLVSMTRPNLNAVALVPGSLAGAVASTGFDVLRTVDVLPAWVFNRVRSHRFVSDVCAGLQGVVYPAIRPNDVRRHEMPIPPLPEQHRIVAAIESYFTRLDDAAASLERVQRNLKRYRASVLKAAVEGRLVPTEAELARAEGRDYEPASVLLERILAERRQRWEEWGQRGKYREPVAPKMNDLPALPEGWCWASVEQVASAEPRSIQSGPFGSNLRHSEFRKLGRLVIGIDNVQDGYFSLGMNHRISEEKFVELEKYRARAGDVLVTVMATIGRCCVVPDDIEASLITKHVYRVSPDQRAISSRYLLLNLWGGRVVRQQLFGRAQGQTRPGLNGTIIRSLSIPVPPIPEQRRIVEASDRLLSVHRGLVASVDGADRRCSRLRQGILKWAFEGKLAHQDPNDEPATVMLEKIRAEKAGAVAPREPRARRSV